MLITQIEIASSPEKVRDVFLDFAKIPEWHKGFIGSIAPADASKPTLEEGDKLDCVVAGRPFVATLTDNSEAQFQWQGPPVAGLVAAKHSFRFEPNEATPGWTTFVHCEEYSGALSFLFSPLLAGRLLKPMFVTFNKDIKARVESESGSPPNT